MGRRAAGFVLAACLAMSVLAGPASAAARPAKTTGSISCKRKPGLVMRCSMAIRGGAGISGIVTMRITSGTVVVATGHGRLTGGRATLTMRLRAPLTRGDYKVAMKITHATINATMVLRVG